MQILCCYLVSGQDSVLKFCTVPLNWTVRPSAQNDKLSQL